MSHSELMKNDAKKRSYLFSLEVIKCVNNIPRNRVNFVILDQLLRSGTSIGANIVEAIAASSKKDFINYLQIALKSAYETQYWICLIRDAGLAPKDEMKQLLEEVVQISKMLSSSLVTLKKKS